MTLAACGGGGEQATAPTTQPGQQAPPGETTTAPSASARAPVTIEETEFRLSHSTPRVRPGTVRLRAVNRGRAVHALEVHAPSGEVETRELQPGQSQTLSLNLDRAGRYEMYCPVGNHKEMGMDGAVVVG